MDRPSDTLSRNVSEYYAATPPTKIRRFIAYAAAVFIPIALIIGLFIRINSQVDLLADDGYDEVYVPNGERMQVLFQDGSKVHLNSGSRIRYPKNSVSPNVRFIWKERLGSRSPRTRIGLYRGSFLYGYKSVGYYL